MTTKANGIAKILKSKSKDVQSVFVLKYFELMSAREICATLDINPVRELEIELEIENLKEVFQNEN